jgi:hypothetical protein
LLPNVKVRVTNNEPEFVCLDQVDFAPILALAEPLLTEARRLADWAHDSHLDDSGAAMLLELSDRWLALEAILDAYDMGAGNARWCVEDETRHAAASCLHDLARGVRKNAEWFRYLPDITNTCLLCFAPDACLGMPHAVFARRLAVAVELLQKVVAVDKSQKQEMPVDRGTDSRSFSFPLTVQLDPPAGLSDEWNKVYRALADPISVVTAFYSHANVHLGSLDSLTAWRNRLSRARATAREALADLNGRVPSTWYVGQAIIKAIGPVSAALDSVVHFLTYRLLAQPGQEKVVAHWREILAELGGFDGRPLLAELAAAVTGESEVKIGASGTVEKKPAAGVDPGGKMGEQGGGTSAEPSEQQEPPPPPDESHPDGLDDDGLLWWENEPHKVPAGNVYRLLKYMWGRDSASYDSLVTDKVFRTEQQPQSINSWAYKANQALPPGVPWRLSSNSVDLVLTKVARNKNTEW